MSECRPEGLVTPVTRLDGLVQTPIINGLVRPITVMGSALVPQVAGISATVRPVSGLAAAVPPVLGAVGIVKPVQGLSGSVTTVQGTQEEFDILLLARRIRSVQEGATRNIGNIVELWSIHPSLELPSGRPPFSITDTYVQVTDDVLLPTPYFRDSGVLCVDAVLKCVNASGGNDNFQAVIQLETAPDFDATGKTPTTLGTWAEHGSTFTSTRIDVNDTKTVYVLFTWEFRQIASAQQFWVGETLAVDATGSFTSTMAPGQYPGVSTINVDFDRQIRMNVKTVAALPSGMTVQLLCTDALILNPRVVGPLT